MHFHQASELAGSYFIFSADRVEEGEVEEFRCWNAGAGAFLGEVRGEGGVEGDLGEGAVGEEAGVVAVVAEVVEGFVGVFDGYFEAGGGGEKGVDHGVVEVGAVAVGVVGGEDEELRDAGAVGEGIWGYGLRGGEGEVVEIGGGGLMGGVGYEAIGG